MKGIEVINVNEYNISEYGFFVLQTRSMKDIRRS